MGEVAAAPGTASVPPHDTNNITAGAPRLTAHTPSDSTGGSSSAPAKSEGEAKNSFLPFVAGSLSALVSTVGLQPLDVVRTRLQLPASGSTAGSSRRLGGMVGTFRTILHNEGVTGLWKGGTASTLRVSFGAGLYFALQNWGLSAARAVSTASVATAPPGGAAAAATAQRPLSAGVTAAIGSGARTVAAVICAPISVIKTRFEAAATVSEYRGVVHALRTIAEREGVRGLYAGIGPTITRDAPYAGLHLVFYTRVKEALSKRKRQNPAANALVGDAVVQSASGFIAGGAATAITHPFDVIKTRIQIERLARLKASQAAATISAPAAATAATATVAYSSVKPETVFGMRSLNAARAIVLDSGPMGLTAGMIPRILKRALSNAVTWMSYEQIVRAGKGKSFL